MQKRPTRKRGRNEETVRVTELEETKDRQVGTVKGGREEKKREKHLKEKHVEKHIPLRNEKFSKCLILIN